MMTWLWEFSQYIEFFCYRKVLHCMFTQHTWCRCRSWCGRSGLCSSALYTPNSGRHLCGRLCCDHLITGTWAVCCVPTSDVLNGVHASIENGHTSIRWCIISTERIPSSHTRTAVGISTAVGHGEAIDTVVSGEVDVSLLTQLHLRDVGGSA